MARTDALVLLVLKWRPHLLHGTVSCEKRWARVSCNRVKERERGRERDKIERAQGRERGREGERERETTISFWSR